MPPPKKKRCHIKNGHPKIQRARTRGNRGERGGDFDWPYMQERELSVVSRG
ncbi:MAG: hypothetical protein BJ554DRAFT_6592 [Olpidium bornovanus]|uniref:Uncharacterized protein n=1 Tax=Olpidium bornovanus TaxID=278681 RepID=A0A8H8A2N0_9FUNG|nr:MAG: hypothetical protein BJ554DRAFT_6592 [Olpidium bornovanus]